MEIEGGDVQIMTRFASFSTEAFCSTFPISLAIFAYAFLVLANFLFVSADCGGDAFPFSDLESRFDFT